MDVNENWKTRVLLVGAAVGALVGLGAAYMLARAAEENNGGPPEVKSGDILKIGVSVIGLMRGIASLADR
jgi:hypothetical protein